MRRLVGFLATGFLLVLAFPALAWPADMHRSLVETAFLISPSAKARIPGEYLDAVLRGAKEATKSGEPAGDCTFLSDAPEEAQRAMDFLLRNPKWSHNYALNVGRMLHFAADSVVPDAVEQGAHDVRRAFFTNHDFVVFREPHDLSGPLAAALRAVSKEAHFADTPSEDDGFRYRAAVNVIADGLLRLPPLPGAEPAPDGGLGLFVVDTLDTGLGGMHVIAESSRATGATKVDRTGTTWHEIETTTWYDPARSWGGKRRTIAIDHEGIHVMDRANKKVGDDVVTRMAIFNNTVYCGSQLVLSSGRWKLDVLLDIPPHAVRVVEVRVPLSAAVGAMTTSEFKVSELCRTKQPVAQLTGYAKVSGTIGVAPNIQEAARYLFPTEAPKEKRPFSK